MSLQIHDAVARGDAHGGTDDGNDG